MVETRIGIDGYSMAKVRRHKSGVKPHNANYAIISVDGTLKQITGKRRFSGLLPLAVGSKKSGKIAGWSGKVAVVKQRVHGSNGHFKTVYAIDLGSSTLGNDLGYAFGKNVAKARRENKKKVGVADAVTRK
jgi:hypothetical protein